MKLAFDATFVGCSEAIDGEIVQISFDTISPSDCEDSRCSPYVLIGRYFEFPDSATVEWHDGHDYDGGAEIVCIDLGRDRVLIKLDQGLELDLTFRLSAVEFAQLRLYLGRMVDDPNSISLLPEQGASGNVGGRPSSISEPHIRGA